MLDVHPPHHTPSTWRDFFIHIATIVIGLLIAVGLEQSIEAIHHHHQRRQLDEDLRVEAESNVNVIERDLRMQSLEAWFEQAQAAAAIPSQKQPIHFALPPPPCVTGSVGTATDRYFAPSEAVWTTARESGLVSLLPADQARFQTRLSHNYTLLAENRTKVYDGCQSLLAMRTRLAQPGSPGTPDSWTMNLLQAESFAATAAQTKIAIQALLFRLRWSKLYEEAIIRGETRPDVRMMAMDQTSFEDAPNPHP